MRTRWLLFPSVLLAAGCGGGHPIAPVSGKVTLNGKALEGAIVSFQPLEASRDAGIGSTGKTDANGQYRLKTADGKDGAIVGKHKVVITHLTQQAGEGDQRPPRGGWPMAEKVPEEYNSKSKLTFEVLPAGTTEADFPLKSSK
jgi:hypothetical protein